MTLQDLIKVGRDIAWKYSDCEDDAAIHGTHFATKFVAVYYTLTWTDI